MKLELTEQDGDNLIKLLDHAVRAQGLSIAGPALFFFNKIKQAFEEEKKNESETRIRSSLQSGNEEVRT